MFDDSIVRQRTEAARTHPGNVHGGIHDRNLAAMILSSGTAIQLGMKFWSSLPVRPPKDPTPKQPTTGNATPLKARKKTLKRKKARR